MELSVRAATAAAMVAIEMESEAAASWPVLSAAPLYKLLWVLWDELFDYYTYTFIYLLLLV